MNNLPVSRKLFDRTFSFIERSLDLRSLGHKVLSGNIVNAETPEYHAREVPFQKILEKNMDPSMNVQLKRTHPRHLPEDPESEVEVETSEEAVDIDKEMVKLAENNLMFQVGVQSLIKRFEALRFTITDAGR